MPDRALVLDANILIRAVLGNRVRGLLETYSGVASFFVPELAVGEAQEHLAGLVIRRGGDPDKALRLLQTITDLVSADSIRQSVDWVRTHNSQQFLESFYFQYGHQSIADLGDTVLCFEGISELAASEVEDEVLWDGQAKSSRYQDFSRSGFITPPEFDEAAAVRYQAAGAALLEAYAQVHGLAREHLTAKLSRPESMKPDAYARNIAARAFDVARYLLFWGVPTNVGQVTSIRTLEKQIRRLRVSPFAELREVAEEISRACAVAPECVWDPAASTEPSPPRSPATPSPTNTCASRIRTSPSGPRRT